MENKTPYFKKSLQPKQIVYLDSHLLVVKKPALITTQPTSQGGLSLEDQAKAFIKERFKKPGGVFLTPIHRLDYPVSGLVLFARTSKSLSRLQTQMRTRQIEKRYYARVKGHLKEKRGHLKHLLLHGRRRAIISDHLGKESTLTYRVLKEWKESSLLEVHPHTGRYHQIRVQLSYLGHPIWGDTKYGFPSKSKSKKIDLHHGKLVFRHPITGVKISLVGFSGFFCPDWAEWEKVFG